MSVPILEPASVKNQPIPVAPEFVLLLAEGSKILELSYLPDGRPCFFILMNPDPKAFKKKRTFRLFLSGSPLGECYQDFIFIGTVVAQHPISGQQNFHCFEVPEPRGMLS